MTTDEMNSSFMECREMLMKVARKVCYLPHEDAEDMVCGTYAWILGCEEGKYAEVPVAYAYRKWKLWLMSYMKWTMRKRKNAKHIEKEYSEVEGPLEMKVLSEMEINEVLDARSEGLSYSQVMKRKRMVRALLPPGGAAH